MADLQTIFYQVGLALLRDAQFTSASPGHINEFIRVTGANTSIGTDEEIKQAIKDIVESLGVKVEETDKDKPSTASSGATSLLKSARGGVDPLSVITSQAKTLVPVLIPLLIAAGIGKIILDTSLSPGGILDRRLRRVITEEVNGLLDKQTQKNFHIGLRQLTIQSRSGFRSIQGIGSEDNLRQIREGLGSGLRKSNLDYIDFSKGVRDLRE